MKAYRESFTSEDGQQGLTQEGLLRRMASMDGEYADRFSHATVSRWEAGATRPTVHRLRVFGMALGLSPTEVAGLILLAGLAPDFHAASYLVSHGGGASLSMYLRWTERATREALEPPPLRIRHRRFRVLPASSC